MLLLISFWWVPLAFLFGTMLGVGVMCLCAAAKESPQGTEEDKDQAKYLKAPDWHLRRFAEMNKPFNEREIAGDAYDN